ncbi:MAG: hypothetical protein ABI553_08345 [Chloroflexota bacterium]
MTEPQRPGVAANHRGLAGLDVDRTLFDEPIEELDQKQWIPACASGEREQLRRWRGAQPLRRQIPHALHRQRRKGNMRRTIAEQSVDQSSSERGIFGASSQQEKHRKTCKTLGQGPHHAKRSVIGPMQVVDSEHNRRLVGELLDLVAEGVDARRLRGASRRLPAVSECLMQRLERRRQLGLWRSPAKREKPSTRGDQQRMANQEALADTGFPFDYDDLSDATRRAVDPRGEKRDLLCAVLHAVDCVRASSRNHVNTGCSGALCPAMVLVPTRVVSQTE